MTMDRQTAKNIIRKPGHFAVRDVNAACDFIAANPVSSDVDNASWINRANVCRWAHAVPTFFDR